MWAGLSSLSFQKELGLSETTEDTLEGWEEAVVKCSDTGMQQTDLGSDLGSTSYEASQVPEFF